MNNRILADILMIISAIGFVYCAGLLNETFYWKISCIMLISGLIMRMIADHINKFAFVSGDVE